MVDTIPADNTKVGKVEFLKVLTKPLVDKIVRIDGKIEACWRSENKYDSSCQTADPGLNKTSMLSEELTRYFPLTISKIFC